MIRLTLFLGLLFGVLSVRVHGADAPVPIDFFFETGCDSCAEIRRDVVPDLAGRYGGAYELREWDIGSPSNYLMLVAWQDKLGSRDNEPVSMVIDGATYLAGLARIRSGLFPALDAALARRQAGAVMTERPVLPVSGNVLQRRLESFTLVGVVSAAAIDSINPCAISTLVFFMSLLSVARIGIRRMWLAGGAFLVACFATYLAIGFGLMQVLQVLTSLAWLKQGLEALLVVIMLGFACLSFRDAYRYHRTGQAEDISVKLPASIQARIHGVMRTGLRKRSLVLGGVGVGVAVTLLESVCTGQVYVPALVMMLKSGDSLVRPALYLLLYNVIFVIPLAVALVLTCGGLGTPSLVEWSRRNVTVSKTLMGVFFLVMTGLMIVLR